MDNLCKELFSKWPKNLRELALITVHGGKKIRFNIIFQLAKSLNKYSPENELLKAGTAIELIHTSSLILDDLPFMDNGKTRREKDCIHIKHGIAFTQLTALSMFSEATNLLLKIDYDNYMPITEILKLLPRFIGPNEGLIAGQTYDLLMKENKVNNWNEYYKMADGKTSSLFILSFCLGWILGQGALSQLENIIFVARWFGRYFQIKDDINDAEKEKNIYNNCVSLFGKEECLTKLEKCKDKYIKGLKNLKIFNKYLLSIIDFD